MLIKRWADAVQRQDIEAIIEHHTTDFVMFDVPPPNELEGIDAYRDSWAPFFEHFKNGGVFAMEKLDITVSDQAGFATALLLCGTKEELEKDPKTRLRLTVGLRRDQGHWLIAHEHHSYPFKSS